MSATDNKVLSIVIPCYNEEKNIELRIKQRMEELTE
jgi:hypothetical protein